MKIETKVIHAGQAPDPQTGAVMTPIYATSTYAQTSPGEHKGFDYARTRNPTRDAGKVRLATCDQSGQSTDRLSPAQPIERVFDAQHGRRIDRLALEDTRDQLAA